MCACVLHMCECAYINVCMYVSGIWMCVIVCICCCVCMCVNTICVVYVRMGVQERMCVRLCV